MIEKLPRLDLSPVEEEEFATALVRKLNEVIDAVNRIEDGTRCPSRCPTWNVRCDLTVPHEGLHRHGNTEDGAVYWGSPR